MSIAERENSKDPQKTVDIGRNSSVQRLEVSVMSKGKNDASQKLIATADQAMNNKDSLKAKMNALRDNATTDLDAPNLNDLPNSLSDASLNLANALSTISVTQGVKFNKDINMWDNNP